VIDTAPALIAYGFVLGWSVAWPPGPINAEMLRRGLAHGFTSAFAVGLGACSGDALWAIAVVLGAGLLIGPSLRGVLLAVSSALLFVLAALYLHGAWKAWRDRRAGGEAPSPTPSARGSYLLGLSMALTSPWNLAFWLAVIGSAGVGASGIGSAFIVAGAVVSGAMLWCLVFCTMAARLGAGFGGAAWQIIAKGATGLLLLGFAVRGILRFAAG